MANDPEEQSVFGIDPKRLPRMGVTWFCYEAVKLIADADTWDADLIRDARQEHPYWCDEAPSQLEFADFAKEYAGLVQGIDAFYNKNRCWRVRMGITRFPDEPQQPDNELPNSPSARSARRCDDVTTVMQTRFGEQR